MPARKSSPKRKAATSKKAAPASKSPASKKAASTAPARKKKSPKSKLKTPLFPPGTPADIMNAMQIAQVLQQIAALLEITGANTFKVRAYENASRIVPGLGEDLPGLIEGAELQKVRGIGGGIAERVEVLARTGKLDYFEELKAQVPMGLLEMLRVPGLGPKKIKLLFDEVDIATIEALEEACQNNSLADLKGFGEKTQQNILRGIAHYRRINTRFLWKVAYEYAAPVFETLLAKTPVDRAEMTGSLRRKRETVKDVDIVISTKKPDVVSSYFAEGEWTERVLGSGTTKTSIVHKQGLQMDLRVVNDREYPYALHHFTGSKAHNVAMRGRAQRMGVKINEYGLFRGDELIPCCDEKEIFAALGLAYVPPELREDLGEIEAAENDTLPARLLETDDLRGAFHAHTAWGTGADTPEAMIDAAAARDWDYLGISDVSTGVDAEHGLTAGRFQEQREAVRKAAAQKDIHVFRGLECEIRRDGTLEFDAGVLREFDYTIATLARDFDLDRDAQTRRLLRALENPHVTILASPTARIIDTRQPIEIDHAAVYEAAARRGVALEVNGRPERMDLDGAEAKHARDKGVMLCVDADARSVAELDHVRFAVGLARRGWLEVRHVLNTWSLAKMREHLEARRDAEAGS